MTYTEAAGLTWPQVMHSMGIDPNEVSERDVAGKIAVGQDVIFDRIVIRRQCLAVDLLRMPIADLITQVREESAGQSLAIELLLSGLRRYAGLPKVGS